MRRPSPRTSSTASSSPVRDDPPQREGERPVVELDPRGRGDRRTFAGEADVELGQLRPEEHLVQVQARERGQRHRRHGMDHLGPLRAEHVLGDDAREPRLAQELSEALHPGAGACRKLADDGGAVERVPGAPRLHERASDHAHAADDRLRPAPGAQHVVLLRTVLERHREAEALAHVGEALESLARVGRLREHDRDLRRLDPLRAASPRAAARATREPPVSSRRPPASWIARACGSRASSWTSCPALASSPP